jgi:hypothetical protein
MLWIRILTWIGLIPTGVLAWRQHDFSLGEWCLAVLGEVLLLLWRLYERTRPARGPESVD